MHWNAERYESWFDSPEGHVALARETMLLEAMTSGWPRRGKKLLEIGCGTGIFLELLWRMGFDVTGLDKSQSMLEGARKRLGDRATLQVGDGSHMPFDDNTFDYVVLWSVLEFSSRPEAMLEEAARVAEKGVLVGFLNRYSLYNRFNLSNSSGTLSRAKLMSSFQVAGMLRTATDFLPVLSKSVLPGPLSTWTEGPVWKRVNDLLYPAWAGAFSAHRVDLGPHKPLTPLLLWKSDRRMKEAQCGSGAACSGARRG